MEKIKLLPVAALGFLPRVLENYASSARRFLSKIFFDVTTNDCL